MRSVSFLDFTEFALEGNVMSKALILGDVNNDGHSELVVGTTEGVLNIYRGLHNSHPWLCAYNLGMIACIGIGDLCNQGHDSLYCLSTDGWCYIFQITCEAYKEENKHENSENNTHIITPTFSQKLSPNSKACVITDIDGDGKNEMVVAYSDRMVRTFKWMTQPTSTATSIPSFSDHSFVLHEKWKLAGQIGSMTVRTLVSGGVEVLVSQPGGSYVTLICSSATTAPSAEKNNKRNKKYNYNNSNYVYTNDDSEDSSSVDGGKEVPNDDCIPGTSICYHPLGSFRARNGNVSTEIISNIAKNNRQITYEDNSLNNSDGTNNENKVKNNDSVTNSTSMRNDIDSTNMDSSPHRPSCNDSIYYSAICTLDGTLTLIDEDSILWSLYIDHQLFSLNKMDITGDGSEEVVACSWDGHTYIVNLCKQVVRFHFRDHVAAFCSGKLSLENGRMTNCMCYATFTGRLVVYYDMDLTSVAIKSACKMAEEDESILSMLRRLGVDVDDTKARNRYLKKILYKPRKFLKQTFVETKTKTCEEESSKDDEETKPIQFKIGNDNNEQK